MWATYKGHIQAVELLLERNADVNAHGNYHISSLLWASGRGHSDIVKMLVRRGAKVNVGDKYGTTALVWACRKGNVEIVDCLLKAGANVDTAGMVRSYFVGRMYRYTINLILVTKLMVSDFNQVEFNYLIL